MHSCPLPLQICLKHCRQRGCDSLEPFDKLQSAPHGRAMAWSRDRSRRNIKNQENDAPPEEIKRKIVFSDLRNPPNNFTPLFGEVAKFGTLTKKDEQ